MPQFQSRAALLDDGAVYQRTGLGQRELLRRFDGGDDMRILARVNGYTQLRQLIELAPDHASELTRVLPDLFERGLIELVDA